VAIGKAGARNAGYLAAQMLALSDPGLAERLRQDRETKGKEILAKNAELGLTNKT
jgi:5-(carboxyamino)imidazole ribonucleotide mutase